MHFSPFILLFIFILLSIFSVILAQQPYIGLYITKCFKRGDSHSIRGYSCNGLNHSCLAYLTYRSQPLYNSISTISSLLNADPSQVAEINSVSLNATFETNDLVIVPVNCSCSGPYYQANTSYIVQETETPLLIANNIFGGLTTCHALLNQNKFPGGVLVVGSRFHVPLRCACPTKNQTDRGIKYLLSYLVASGDSVSVIAKKFGVRTNITLEANNLSNEHSMIYPFTTLLIPLQNPPSKYQNGVRSPTSDQPQSPPTSSDRSSASSKTKVYVVVGVLGGSIIALVLFLGIIIFHKHHLGKTKKKDDSKIEKPEGKRMEDESEELPEILSSIAQSVKVYGFKELQRATDDFSSSSWIKGSVYRGIINGDLAAIKKMEGYASKEIEILNKVTHSNIIRLSGVSFNEGHWYLVYEYADNGALSDWIYINNTEGKFLSWNQRLQIALDVANGLDYLHSFTSPPHVHKNLNSNNILLDSDLRGKIANFGLAWSLEGDDEEIPMTRHIVGTKGYLAPEYLENGLVSTKLDVYAFGVLMLDLLTGKEVAAIYAEDKKNLEDVLSAILGEESGQERLRDFMDPSLQGNYPLELAMFVVRIIDNCVKKDLASRPAMPEIVSSLSRILNSSLTWETSANISGYHSFSRNS